MPPYPSPSSRPTYTPKKISAYLSHISVPTSFSSFALRLALDHAHKTKNFLLDAVQTLSFITELQWHQLATVPFEDLSLHYSQSHCISLDHEVIYGKIVPDKVAEAGRVREGRIFRGGYCMENNAFFGTVLRSMGFEVYSAGARVHERGSYLPWSHMVNILTIPSTGQKYMLDVGFGANGPIAPLPLNPGEVSPHIYPATMRLVHENIEENTDPAQRLWVYQHRQSDKEGEQWVPQYCFTELEFLPVDYELMNFYTSQSPQSWFTQTVVVVRFLLGEDGSELVGTVMMVGGEIKRRIRGQTEVVKICRSEEERVQALEEMFRIRLDDVEKRGIRKLVTELKG